MQDIGADNGQPALLSKLRSSAQGLLRLLSAKGTEMQAFRAFDRIKGVQRHDSVVFLCHKRLAPLSIEMLNLWNDFRKVVQFIDENPWVKPMLERIVKDKNRGMR